MNKEYNLIDYEVFLVEALRNFDFLRELKFIRRGFNLFGHERSLVFSNPAIDREVTILFVGQIDIFISRRKPKFFSFGRFNSGFSVRYFSDYLGAHNLNNLQSENEDNRGYLRTEKYSEILNAFADFIQEHLHSVINGTKWINEIVDVRKVESLKKE